MLEPLSRKWNPDLYQNLKRFVLHQSRLSDKRLRNVPAALTMPFLEGLSIGAAKRMTAAIMFFDFENFTAISSHITLEETLTILNIATTTVMRIVREWRGIVEKHTGDGIMAIFGTETRKTDIIAQEAIESAATIRYLMKMDILPLLRSKGLPSPNFRIGIEMGEVLISRMGLHSMNFLTAIGTAANCAAKLQGLANQNGITIGENIAVNLHPFLQESLEKGDDPKWDWKAPDGEPYNYYHYTFEWPEPKLHLKWLSQFRRTGHLPEALAPWKGWPY